MVKASLSRPRQVVELARVLLVDDDPTSRLTLQTVLEAGGYYVDAAASAAEAVGMLTSREYELVLSDLQMESPQAGLKVLAHARMMDYKPATALITTYRNSKPRTPPKKGAQAIRSSSCARPGARRASRTRAISSTCRACRWRRSRSR